jgi:bacillithiol system protein YtxJ
MIKDLRTVQDYQQLIQDSHSRPVLLLKHSTRCPISASRWRAFQEFAEDETRADFYRVLVVENRSLAQHITQDTGIRHESPQAFLFDKGQAIWNSSHWSITPESMSTALENAV